MSILDLADGLGRPLSPAQRVILRVAIDGVDPIDLPPDEIELGRELFGGVERFTQLQRQLLVLVLGARAGKSSVFAALVSLYRAFTADLSTLAPGERAVALIVAPDLPGAVQTMSFVLGLVEDTRFVLAKTTTSVTLARPDGHEVRIEARPATAKGRATRSRTLVSAVLEECAFFENEDYAVSDVEVFKSITPRLLPDGIVLLVSTPWSEQGLLWDEHSRNFGHPVTGMAVHAPTLRVLDTDRNRAVYELEVRRDPVNAEREYGAKFLTRGVTAFFDVKSIEAAIDDTELKPRPPADDFAQCFGGDFAFERDSAALVGCQRTPGRYALSSIDEIRPDGQALKPSEVVGSFATVMHQWGSTELMADAHYRQSIVEHLAENDMYFVEAPAGQSGKAESYILFRGLLNEGRLKIPRHAKLIEQLKEVRFKALPGGGVSIEVPRKKTGGHGDIVSGAVLSVFLASLKRVKEIPVKPAFGTKEFDEAYREERISKRIAAQRRKETDRERAFLDGEY